MKTSISLFIFLNLFTPHAFSSENQYLDGLIDAASQERLYAERYWEAILHYRHSGADVYSLIDDPKFFLSPKGKYSPEDELKATIAAFFEEDKDPNRHPRCRFPARYEWLKDRLRMDEGKLPPAKCEEFDKTYSTVNPKSAVLIFPASYMNSPASMFGHTLIRIDSSYESKLISYAVNYAALTDESNGLVFAFKGIFGYYKGYYSVLPYYEKVKEYNDMDQRDMWEYSLSLSEDEVRKMFLHVWELKDIYSYYYFFDENCSYNLLFLFESARPSLNLTGDFGRLVIPSDTIRAVSASGIIKDIQYRPAKATRIKALASKLSAVRHEKVLGIMDGAVKPAEVAASPLPRDERIIILDLASDLLQYRFSREEIEKEKYTGKLLNTLSARSSLGKADEGIYGVPVPPRPDGGHGTNRLGIGGGVKVDSLYNEIRYRPTYHDLLDPQEGYLEGSQIIFADAIFRYYHSDEKLRIEALDFINIFSIAPRDSFFKPLSWKVDTGIFREEFQKNGQRTVYKVYAGPGVACRFLDNGLVYAFVEPELKLGKGLDRDYALGGGGSAGILKPLSDRWKVQLQLRGISFMAGDEHSVVTVELNQRFTIDANNALKLSLKRERFDGFYYNDFNVSWNRYF